MLKDMRYNIDRGGYMKKKIIIVLGVIIGIFLVLVAYFFFFDMNQENQLKAEITELEELVNAKNIDIEAVNQKLNETVAKDDYAKVEKAFKAYLKDSFDNSIAITEILNDARLTNILTVENYQKDGKEFTQTKQYIAETKQELEERKKKYTEHLTEEKAISYINDKGLDSYYVEFYKRELVGEMSDVKQDKTVENSIDEILSLLDSSEKVIQFLASHPNDWNIEGETIAFSNPTLKSDYDQLIAQVVK